SVAAKTHWQETSSAHHPRLSEDSTSRFNDLPLAAPQRRACLHLSHSPPKHGQSGLCLLLQHFLDDRHRGVGPCLVAWLRQIHAVIDQGLVNLAVLVQEFAADIEILDVLAIVKLGDARVHILDKVLHRLVSESTLWLAF